MKEQRQSRRTQNPLPATGSTAPNNPDEIIVVDSETVTTAAVVELLPPAAVETAPEAAAGAAPAESEAAAALSTQLISSKSLQEIHNRTPEAR